MRAQFGHFDREEIPPPPPAPATAPDENFVQAPALPTGDGEELVNAQAPPSPTGDGEDLVNAQNPPSPTGDGEEHVNAHAPPSPTGDAESQDLVMAQAPQVPVTDNGAVEDASDHDVDTLLAAKEEQIETMQVAVLKLTEIMKDDGVHAQKYKFVCVQLAQTKSALAQTKSALAVSDNRANALCLELQNMKQLQNTADDELKGELHQFIDGLHKKRKKKLLESDVGDGLGMYNEGQE